MGEKERSDENKSTIESKKIASSEMNHSIIYVFIYPHVQYLISKPYNIIYQVRKYFINPIYYRKFDVDTKCLIFCFFSNNLYR